MIELKRGTQIIYVPTHAEGDTNHPDCESGFVTSLSKDGKTAFCRYWGLSGMLRTKLNSESTKVNDLIIHVSVPRTWVENALEEWCG